MNKNIKFTVACDVRKKYFKYYSDLNAWIEKTKKEAQRQGYVRSPYGAIRRLPQLTYQGRNVDQKKNANLLNIALNSRIQNMEVVVVHRAMLKINKCFKDHNMKSRFFGQVHDSGETYTHKEETDFVWSKIKEYSKEYYPEYNGINLDLEGNLSDYFGKNELWHMGQDLE